MRYYTENPNTRAHDIANHEADTQYKKYGPEINYFGLWLDIYYAALSELTLAMLVFREREHG